MRSTLTDGSIIDIPDYCFYCNLSTGGEHQADCPLYQVPDGMDIQEICINQK